MDAQQAAALELLRLHPVRVAEWCGLDRLAVAPHGAWLDRMINGASDMTLQAHRGSYKTTCLAVALAVIMVTEARKNIIFLRKGDDDVAEVVRQVAQVLQSDAMLTLTAHLYGEPVRLTRRNVNELTTDCYAAHRGAPQLVGIGTGGSITGKHADVVATDDIVNLKDRVSRAERERTKGVVMELRNIVNPGGRLINTGTPWHRDDAFGLMGDIQRHDCYSTGLLTAGQIETLKGSMTPSLFAANYELRHIAADGALFVDARYGDADELAAGGYAHIDAGYGGEDGTALSIGNKHGDAYHVYGRLWQCHVDECLEEILALAEKFRAGRILCETNGDKGYLAKEIRRRGGRAQGYHEAMNKHLKITSYLRAAWPNIYFAPGSDPEYVAQILDYTETAGHDDAPDSAACLVRRQYWRRDEDSALPSSGVYGGRL